LPPLIFDLILNTHTPRSSLLAPPSAKRHKKTQDMRTSQIKHQRFDLIDMKYEVLDWMKEGWWQSTVHYGSIIMSASYSFTDMSPIWESPGRESKFNSSFSNM
jgi:hypothetical protein